MSRALCFLNGNYGGSPKIQPSAMPCSKHCLHCVGKVSAIQIGQEWDLRVCVLHALAWLCFQLLWLCLSGLPPVPMHCNMLGIREHISLWTRVSLHSTYAHTLLIRKRLIHTLIIRTHAHRMIYLLVLIITHAHTHTPLVFPMNSTFLSH